MKQRIQGPADPEIFFDVLDGGADAGSGGKKKTAAVFILGGKDVLKGRVHAARRRRLAGKDALASGKSGRRKSCIQEGKADMPALRNWRRSAPCTGSESSYVTRLWLRW